jgi:beta-galactosidase
MELLPASEDGKRPWTEEGPHDFVYITLKTGNQPNVQTPLPSSDKLSMTETHTFPIGLPDWSNLGVIHKNTLPARASFHLYDNETDALTRDTTKSKALSLSGTWKFNLAKSPFDAPPNFFEKKFDTQKWGKIEVPGMWQLQGYGKGPQYASLLELNAATDFPDIRT